MTERKAMVDKSHKLPINRQCQPLPTRWIRISCPAQFGFLPSSWRVLSWGRPAINQAHHHLDIGLHWRQSGC